MFSIHFRELKIASDSYFHISDIDNDWIYTFSFTELSTDTPLKMETQGLLPSTI